MGRCRIGFFLEGGNNNICREHKKGNKNFGVCECQKEAHGLQVGVWGAEVGDEVEEAGSGPVLVCIAFKQEEEVFKKKNNII